MKFRDIGRGIKSSSAFHDIGRGIKSSSALLCTETTQPWPLTPRRCSHTADPETDHTGINVSLPAASAAPKAAPVARAVAVAVWL